MRPAILSSLLFGCLLLAACSTPETRIARNQVVFASYPAEVQQKIRAGRVEPGFTMEMVGLALGEPARKTTRRAQTGDVEVWIYPDRGPRFSFGLGVSSGGSGSAYGGGLGVSTGGYDFDEKVRVEFTDGKVSTVEYRKK